MEKAFNKDKKICIVDDEPNIVEIYSQALGAQGYQIVSARNGREGLEVMKKEKPDLALIDIMMPEMDGVELMDAMRSDKELENIPVIVMSNVSDREVYKKVERFNTRFYLVKSLFEPKKVVGIVDEVLHGA